MEVSPLNASPRSSLTGPPGEAATTTTPPKAAPPQQPLSGQSVPFNRPNPLQNANHASPDQSIHVNTQPNPSTDDSTVVEIFQVYQMEDKSEKISTWYPHRMEILPTRSTLMTHLIMMWSIPPEII
jgi:hypothetical protein